VISEFEKGLMHEENRRDRGHLGARLMGRLAGVASATPLTALLVALAE
jgi:hypothetical protein